MSTALPKLEGLHTIAANAIGVNVDAAGLKYIPAGEYYWSTTANGGSSSLVAAFQLLLRTGLGGVGTATVTLSATTGKITIAWGGGSHALVWANDASRDRFGAAGNLALATSHVLDNQVEGLWLPNVLGTMNGSVLGVGIPESDRRVTISRSGAVCATSSSERERAVFKWHGLTKAKMWTADESTINESLETFWRDCLNYRGGIFRRHADRTNDFAYTTWQCILEEGLKPTRVRNQYDAVWDSGDIAAMSYVHVAVGGGF